MLQPWLRQLLHPAGSACERSQKLCSSLEKLRRARGCEAEEEKGWGAAEGWHTNLPKRHPRWRIHPVRGAQHLLGMLRALGELGAGALPPLLLPDVILLCPGGEGSACPHAAGDVGLGGGGAEPKFGVSLPVTCRGVSGSGHKPEPEGARFGGTVGAAGGQPHLWARLSRWWGSHEGASGGPPGCST